MREGGKRAREERVREKREREEERKGGSGGRGGSRRGRGLVDLSMDPVIPPSVDYDSDARETTTKKMTRMSVRQ